MVGPTDMGEGSGWGGGVGGGRQTHALLCRKEGGGGFQALFRVADPNPFCRQAERRVELRIM